ncbi:TetR/AcrR family transcriptional regulator [Nocardia takedensis]
MGAAVPEATLSTDDPRRSRSRTRLLEAAEALLRTGGLSAVTVEAVTRESRVARTTMYRHFGDLDHLRARALERVLPALPSARAESTARERLIDLLTGYAATLAEYSPYLTTPARLADTAEEIVNPVRETLRRTLFDRYVRPIEEVLREVGLPGGGRPAAHGTDEYRAVVARLVGPVLFTVLTGAEPADRATCARHVDDFLSVAERR